MSIAADRIVALYERHARQFDADRGSNLILETVWLSRFTALLPAGATILDIGCGTGRPIARHLIEQGYQICGVDSSPTMISLCRTRFPDHEWNIADMRDLVLKRKFQGIIAWDSFFHLSFDDQRRMFPIFRDHVAPGAPLLFTSGPHHGESMGTYCGEPLYHASLSESEYRSLLQSHGFDVKMYIPDDPDCGSHTVSLAQMK